MSNDEVILHLAHVLATAMRAQTEAVHAQTLAIIDLKDSVSDLEVALSELKGGRHG